MLVLTIALVGLLIAFYYFMLLPRQIQRQVIMEKLPSIDNYYKDYENLLSCIEKADHRVHITMCCEAIYQFRIRNRALVRLNVPVAEDTDDLIKLLDKRYYEIQNKLRVRKSQAN
jgi:hypothetical protein